MVEARLSGLQNGDVDAELGELDRRVAVLVLEGAPRASALREPPFGVASVDDEPAVGDGREPDPKSSSCASRTDAILVPRVSAVGERALIQACSALLILPTEVVETRRTEPVAEIEGNGFGGNGFALLVDFKSERLPPFGLVDSGVGMGG